MVCVMLFFFSSRRRHTRFSRDWSSDVCSSDLWFAVGIDYGTTNPFAALTLGLGADKRLYLAREWRWDRSEERRVGKECRSRWARYHYEKSREYELHSM